MNRSRLLLDTNVWRSSWITTALRQFARQPAPPKSTSSQPPLSLYEMLATRNTELRGRLVRAITRGCWFRPMTEIFDEAAQLRHEVQRVRPEWLKQDPDLRYWYKLKADWAGGNFGSGPEDSQEGKRKCCKTSIRAGTK